VCAQSEFNVSRTNDGPVVITKYRTKEISLEDVDRIAAKFQEQKRREVLIQSDLPSTDLQPLASKLEAHGLKVRFVPQVVFR